MNAYELADDLHKHCNNLATKLAAGLLREQADRIAELKERVRALEEQIFNGSAK